MDDRVRGAGIRVWNFMLANGTGLEVDVHAFDKHGDLYRSEG